MIIYGDLGQLQFAADSFAGRWTKSYWGEQPPEDRGEEARAGSDLTVVTFFTLLCPPLHRSVQNASCILHTAYNTVYCIYCILYCILHTVD